MKIMIDDLSGPEIAELLEQHIERAAQHSPASSIHALDLARLRQPDITFWTAWDNSKLMGCGALQVFEPGHGEVKSMRTADAYLRHGVAARILETIIGEARQRGYHRLSLETGTAPAYRPAHGLYRRYGFVECPPFGPYTEDPFSMFMTKTL